MKPPIWHICGFVLGLVLLPFWILLRVCLIAWGFVKLIHTLGTIVMESFVEVFTEDTGPAI